jgi:hypothetical protein
MVVGDMKEIDEEIEWTFDIKNEIINKIGKLILNQKIIKTEVLHLQSF